MVAECGIWPVKMYLKDLKYQHSSLYWTKGADKAEGKYVCMYVGERVGERESGRNVIQRDCTETLSYIESHTTSTWANKLHCFQTLMHTYSNNINANYSLGDGTHPKIHILFNLKMQANMKPALNQLMWDCMISMNSRQHRNMGDLQPPKSQTNSVYSDRHNACR